MPPISTATVGAAATPSDRMSVSSGLRTNEACPPQGLPQMALQNDRQSETTALSEYQRRRDALNNRAVEPTSKDLDTYEKLRNALNSSSNHDMDAKNTEVMINTAMRHWERFCERNKHGDATKFMKRATKGDHMIFLEELFKARYDRGTPYTPNSGETKHRSHRMLFVRINRFEMNAKDSKDIQHLVYGTLIPDLCNQPKKPLDTKPVFDVKCLVLAASFLYKRETPWYADEEQRQQAMTFFAIATPSGCRPGELVDDRPNPSTSKEAKRARWREPAPFADPENPHFIPKRSGSALRPCDALCFEDIALYLSRNPEEGKRPKLGMWIVFAFHKGHENNPLPTILNYIEEDDPLFCPIAHVVALALRRGHFKAPIKSLGDLYKLRIPAAKNSLRIDWKESALLKPLFCGTTNTANGRRTDHSKPLPYYIHNSHMQQLGVAMGFKVPLTNYCCRRGGANSLNEHASAAIRNRVIKHDQLSKTFQKYLNPKIQFDVQAAFLEHAPANEFLKLMCHMDFEMDPRAPTKAPKEYLDRMGIGAEATELSKLRSLLLADIEQRYGSLKKAPADQVAEYKELQSKLGSARTRRLKELDKQFRAEYFDTEDSDEIERQLLGLPPDDTLPPDANFDLPQRERLKVILFATFPDVRTEEDIRSHRVAAVDAMVDICKYARRRPGNQRRTFALKRGMPDSPNVQTKRQCGKTGVSAKLEENDPFPMLLDSKQCLNCFGNSSYSSSDQLLTFKKLYHMWDHADRVHFKKLDENALVACPHPKCASEKRVLNDLTHYKRHAQEVHRVRFRP